MGFEIAYTIWYLAEGTIFSGLANTIANWIYPFY